MSPTLDVDELSRVLVRRVVDRYQNSPHSELGGETPAAAYQRLQDLYGRRCLPNRIIMAMMFGP